nr:PREDICTED: all-trans-retinol 13,14-reductase [Struthio camelus australis]
MLREDKGRCPRGTLLLGVQLENVGFPSRFPPDAAGIQSQLRLVKHGEGGFSIFVGLNGTKEELGLESTNYFIYPGNDLDEMMQRYLTSSRDKAAENIPFLFVTCPSTKDPTWEMRHPGKSTLSVVTFAKYEWFEEWKDKPVLKRGDDYEEVKQAFVDAIMRTVFKLYPRIEDRIEYLSGGTPLTNQHYIGSARGEIYGADQDIARLQAEAIATLRAALLCAPAGKKLVLTPLRWQKPSPKTDPSCPGLAGKAQVVFTQVTGSGRVGDALEEAGSTFPRGAPGSSAAEPGEGSGEKGTRFEKTNRKSL